MQLIVAYSSVSLIALVGLDYRNIDDSNECHLIQGFDQPASCCRAKTRGQTIINLLEPVKRAESGGFLHLWTFSEKAEAEVKEKTTFSTNKFVLRAYTLNYQSRGHDYLSLNSTGYCFC